jgi:diaminopimelate epimerase
VLTRSHGLGNDYLVADPAELPFEVTPERVRLLCDRHVGVGSDGLLVLDGQAGVRIFNPDGSEAEKSGNGLRIFAKWLFDTRRATSDRFTVHTAGGDAPVEIEAEAGRARQVTVDMGAPQFREDLASVELDGVPYPVVAVSMGNPHCVVLRQQLDVTELRRIGPRIEQHPAFPNRTNVQLARVPGSSRARVEMLIWERGAGETQASGSSACAVVAACQRLGLVDDRVTASMPGGELQIRRDQAAHLWLRGPVDEIAHVRLSPELIERLRALP